MRGRFCYFCLFVWLINRNLFLIVLEAGKSKVKAPADWVSGEGLLPGSSTAVFTLCPHVKGMRELSGVSLLRALIAFRRAVIGG